MVKEPLLGQHCESRKSEGTEEPPLSMEISLEEVLLADVQVESRMPLLECREAFVL